MRIWVRTKHLPPSRPRHLRRLVCIPISHSPLGSSSISLSLLAIQNATGPSSRAPTGKTPPTRIKSHGDDVLKATSNFKRQTPDAYLFITALGHRNSSSVFASRSHYGSDPERAQSMRPDSQTHPVRPPPPPTETPCGVTRQ